MPSIPLKLRSSFALGETGLPESDQDLHRDATDRFDDLAKAVANGHTRGSVLKMGAGFAGAALASLLPGASALARNGTPGTSGPSTMKKPNPGNGGGPKCKPLLHKCLTNEECCSRNCYPDKNGKVCGCPAGQTLCNNKCVVCGGGIVNPTTCECACVQGEALCNGQCVALNTSANCGKCGVTCGNNELCCGGECTSVVTEQNCGACNVTCRTGQLCCNGQCTDVTTGTNCGQCGVN